MTVEFRSLARGDYRAAQAMIVPGAHLGWCTKNAVELWVYSRYF